MEIFSSIINKSLSITLSLRVCVGWLAAPKSDLENLVSNNFFFINAKSSKEIPRITHLMWLHSQTNEKILLCNILLC